MDSRRACWGRWVRKLSRRFTMKIGGPAVTEWAGPDGVSVICYLVFVIRPEGPHPMPPILSLTGISKQFPGVTALDSVDFNLLAGEVHALMGENGAGKSTLINIISGLLHPTAGKISLAGEEVILASAGQAQQAGICTITLDFKAVHQLTVAA